MHSSSHASAGFAEAAAAGRRGGLRGALGVPLARGPRRPVVAHVPRAHGRVEGETFGVFAQWIIAAQASFAKNNPLLFKPAGDTELAKDLLPKVQDELLAIVLADVRRK